MTIGKTIALTRWTFSGKVISLLFNARSLSYLKEEQASFNFMVCTDVRIGPKRRLNAKELMLSNCGTGEDSGESLGLQGDQTGQS